MRYSCRLLLRAGSVLAISALALLFDVGTSPVSAQDSSQPEATQPKAHRAPKPYFIEFRARSAATYGHMYVIYGRVNERQDVVQSRIAGLHPAGDAAGCDNCSLFNWTIGHLVPVPSETGASDGDLEEKYVTARYRVWLDARQYKAVDAYIRKRQADSPTWNALWNNCVDFGRDIANHLGLKVPGAIWTEPKDFVTELREMNGVKAKQLPLRDASAPMRSTTVSAISKPASKP